MQVVLQSVVVEKRCIGHKLTLTDGTTVCECAEIPEIVTALTERPDLHSLVFVDVDNCFKCPFVADFIAVIEFDH